jgi:hypothetical protein
MRHFPFVAVAVLALLLPSAAHAAFPGANGDIAFTRDSGGAQKVWAKAPGGAERKISNGGWREREPAYSPDGQRIAYVSHEGGRSVRIPAFGPRETAKVSVAGVRDPYVGRAATKRIKRARR